MNPLTPSAADERVSLIEYPCDFPIKVMGLNVDGFLTAVLAVVQQHDPTHQADKVAVRGSSQGKYLGLTVTVRAISRAQLDQLYQDLSSHPMVKVVL